MTKQVIWVKDLQVGDIITGYCMSVEWAFRTVHWRVYKVEGGNIWTEDVSGPGQGFRGLAFYAHDGAFYRVQIERATPYANAAMAKSLEALLTRLTSPVSL